MCRRFTITVSKEELKDYAKSQYDIDDLGNEYDIPNFNVAPGTNIISVIHDGKKHRIGLLEWGFVPPFTMKEQVGFIDAKSETLFDKPSFRNAALKQRCVILADGFYEWKMDNKQPMRIQTDGKMFSMAESNYDSRNLYWFVCGIILVSCSDSYSRTNNIIFKS